ncbi:helix-turn-helix transcriptional regulator (plasmid) [Limosilactobacillus mucosae]|uniref:helix-turn-helix domain-containing protein n=1 Tax=Limosilactobacillus mucosae TaxID=97478 RepID=UPI0015D5289E|nr:helix-turn-helix transcriptional regulator [Limosilactobacillus mucosae]QLI94501.1 helix-turn-helix transcriptional regulator [Limosilactobacillus mucosae]QLI95470.1 helix-turn-helix transcriptional regulator [Limosilactobacillus mucosae]
MNRLKVLRKKRGLTLKEMSKELKERVGLDITPDALSKYERQERKMRNYEVVEKIACFFCVSIDYLLGNVSNMCREELEEPEEVKQLTDWYDFKYCPYCGRKL